VRRHGTTGGAWVLGLGMMAIAGCMPEGILLTPVSTNRELVEETVIRERGFPSDKIALIDVTGILMNAYEPQFFGQGEHPVSRLLEQLDKAERDSHVVAVVLRINSPGGSVTASELVYQEVVRFRKTTGKPVFAVMMDVAASGGYYVACACDEIWAYGSSVTGSIGVLAQFLDLSGTMQKIGMSAPAITSGPNKDAGSPFRSMTAEQRAIFQSIVDEMYESFVAVVRDGRSGLTEEKVRELADGRVYTAGQALEQGLIDHIGTIRDALAALRERTGSKSVRVVTYRRPLEYRPNYYAQAPGTPPTSVDVNLVKLDASRLPGLGTPQFLYLWAPGH